MENIRTFLPYLKEYSHTPGKPSVIDFYATWCAPCRAMSPFVEQLAREYSDVIDVIKIDIEKNEAFAAAANIHSIPTLFFVDRNGNITRHTGSLPYPELERMTKIIIA